MKRPSIFLPSPQRLHIPAHLRERRLESQPPGCLVVIISAVLWAGIAVGFWLICKR